MNSATVKRLFDLAIAVPALLVSLPIQAAIGVTILTRLGRPILFRQLRPGQYARPFTLVKFRTMLPIDENRGWTDDASRMTPLGAILRASSLDELPTLWNVVRGDMSLVGPRPLLMQYVQRYNPDQSRRHLVRPGVTGLAQVSGRNEIAWETKLALDVKYVDSQTLSLDIRIILETIFTVLRQRGIRSEGHVTATEFMGSANTPGTSG